VVQLKNQKENVKVGPEPVGPRVERIAVPEKKVEVEKPPMPAVEKAPPSEAAEKPAARPAVPPVALPPRPPKSETLIRVEKILEEDLEEMYFKMPPEQQEIFKEKGEEAASKIEKMIAAGKAVAKKILKLIRDWLELIPGVNKFFLEQEAKIKTDKIVALAEKEKEKKL
jgi:hypothetical protein